MKINSKITKTHRDKIWKILLSEGVPVNNKIPCHMLPMFQKKIAFGKTNFPWNKSKIHKNLYKKGTLPVAEKLSEYDNGFFAFRCGHMIILQKI